MSGKMKTTLVGPYYANAPHGAEIGIYNALKELGHEVQIIDNRKHLRTIEAWAKDIIDFQPDMVLCPGCTPPYEFLPIVKNKINVPVVNWNAEEIRLKEYKERVTWGHILYDYIFNFDDSALPIYKELGIENVSWLPLGFDPTRHVHIPMERKPVVVFVGSIGGKHHNREALINFLLAHNVNIRVFTTMDTNKINNIYSGAAMTINLGLYVGDSGRPDDFRSYGYQQRIFEAMGSNLVSLTPEPIGYPQTNSHPYLFDGESIIFYNKNNLIEQIEWYLDQGRYNWCAQNVERLKHKHTYKSRIEQMIKELKTRDIIKDVQ